MRLKLPRPYEGQSLGITLPWRAPFGTVDKASICTLWHNRSHCSHCKCQALCAWVLRPSNTSHRGRRRVGRDEHALDGCRHGEAHKGWLALSARLSSRSHGIPFKGIQRSSGSFESHPSRRPLEGSPRTVLRQTCSFKTGKLQPTRQRTSQPT